MLTILLSSKTLQAGESTIMLKWSAIPDQMEAHEVYIRNSEALYVVSSDTVEMTREDAVPKWLAKEIRRTELVRMAEVLGAIVDERNKEKEIGEMGDARRRRCHGFVWRLDINVGEYNVQYLANCDPKDVRDRVEKLVRSVLGDPLD